MAQAFNAHADHLGRLADTHELLVHHLITDVHYTIHCDSLRAIGVAVTTSAKQKTAVPAV